MSWSMAGRSVNAASSAKTMPIDAIGPSERLDCRSESRRQSSPVMTVPPEARIGSAEPLTAALVASHVLGKLRSSSRNRAT